ncbi:MAG: beta-glucosidase family protein [Candidatus Helarchaeota archaeon]
MVYNENFRIDWDKLRDLPEEDIERVAREIVSKMTIYQKLNQMSGNQTMMRGGISMIIRYNAKPIPAGEDTTLGIPGIYFTDGPRGIVMDQATCFPVSMARGASWDIELEERIGNAIGIEARALGANFFGGVCINLLRHPAWGRAQETYGEDPYHIGEMGAALVRGVQKHVMACVKHFAVNSIENSRFKVDVQIDERTLREIYLPHFKRCVDEGAASIMNAYNKVNGHYCGHNKHLLREILKNEWDFKGFVITDFIFGIRNGTAAVNAGVDIEMPFRWHMKPKKLMESIKAGKIDEELINEAVIRILRQKLKFNKSYDPDFYSIDKVTCAEHIQLALEAARKSIVLLKNENNILPLDKTKIKKLAVFGRLARIRNIGDHGSSRVYPPYVVTILEGLKKIVGNDIEIVYNEGKNMANVRKIAKDSEICIIVVGYTFKDEGEHVFYGPGDRKTLELKPKEQELILNVSEINKNCIVIMEGGSSIITESWRHKIPGILMAWYPGMEGGTAIAEILFGKINPCGKLPIIFPKSNDQLPYFDNKVDLIKYDYYHGYRLLEKNNESAAFPFGFGLSYTKFNYKNLKLSVDTLKKEDELAVSIDVKNIGNRYGEEIVQLYVGYKNSTVDRPIKELKGFTKIKLKPNESKTTVIRFNVNSLSYYDVNTNKWILEPNEYIVYIGPSSINDDLLQATFKIVD